MIVIDASVLGPLLVDDDSETVRFRRRISSEELIAPSVIDLEIASLLRRLCRTGDVDAHRCALAMSALEDYRIERVHHTGLLRRVWELRDNVSAYDASYVALAEALGAVLLTADAKLANAPGPRCRFEVVQ